MKWVWNDKNTPLECQHWNSYAGIPTWSPLVLLGRHGDLKWRPLMGSSVAMATKWRPSGDPSHFGIPMWSPFASVGRHGDLKWRTSDALQFPLSSWRQCGDFLTQIARMPYFTYLWVFLHQILKCPWVLIKPETLDLTTLNTGKRLRIKHKETEWEQ